MTINLFVFILLCINVALSLTIIIGAWFLIKQSKEKLIELEGLQREYDNLLMIVTGKG